MNAQENHHPHRINLLIALLILLGLGGVGGGLTLLTVMGLALTLLALLPSVRERFGFGQRYKEVFYDYQTHRRIAAQG